MEKITKSTMRKIEYWLKHNTILLTVYILVFSKIFKFIGIFIKVDKNKIFLTSNSKGYNDSPKVLYEAMKCDNRFKDAKFVWALDPNVKCNVPSDERVKFNSLKYFTEALSSGIWIASVNVERGLQFKKKQTKFINTWHGIAINKMGNAVTHRNDFDWSSTDIINVSNDFEKEIFVRDFNAKKDALLPIGLPRNDELYSGKNIKSVEFRKKYNICDNKKVILYAPTWRDSQDKGHSYDMMIPITWDKWVEKLSEDYIFVLRMHPNANLNDCEKSKIPFGDFVINAEEENIIDLMIASDILISDYSSTIMDFSILEKPIFCYGFDYEEYNLKRGFYYDLEKEIPNGVIRNELELLQKIETIDFDEQKRRTKSLKKRHAKYGGNATSIELDIISEWLNR